MSGSFPDLLLKKKWEEENYPERSKWMSLFWVNSRNITFSEGYWLLKAAQYETESRFFVMVMSLCFKS